MSCEMPNARCVGQPAIELADGGDTAAVEYVRALCASCPFIESYTPEPPNMAVDSGSPSELVDRIRLFTQASDSMPSNRLGLKFSFEEVTEGLDLEPYTERLGATAVEKSVTRVIRQVSSLESQHPGIPASLDTLRQATVLILKDTVTLKEQKVPRADRQAICRSPAQIEALRMMFADDPILTTSEITTALDSFPRDPVSPLLQYRSNFVTWSEQYPGLLIHDPARFKDICRRGSPSDLEQLSAAQQSPDLPPDSREALRMVRAQIDPSALMGGEINPAAKRRLLDTLESQPPIQQLKEQLGDHYDTAINSLMRMLGTLNSDTINAYRNLEGLVTDMAVAHLRDISRMRAMGIYRPSLYALKFSYADLKELMRKHTQRTWIDRKTGKSGPLLSGTEMVRIINNQGVSPTKIEQILEGFDARMKLGVFLFGKSLTDFRIRRAATDFGDIQGFINALIKANPDFKPNHTFLKRWIQQRVREARRLQNAYSDNPYLTPDRIALLVFTEDDAEKMIAQEAASQRRKAKAAAKADNSKSSPALKDHESDAAGDAMIVNLKHGLAIAMADLEAMQSPTSGAIQQVQTAVHALRDFFGDEHPIGNEIQALLSTSIEKLEAALANFEKSKEGLQRYNDDF